MDNNAALKTRLEQLSPEQRTALLQQIARRREQQGHPQSDGQRQSRPTANSRYPLSLAQRRLWLLSQLGNEAGAAYNIASAFCFERHLDRERLQRAWRRLLSNHEVLRSAFVQQGDDLFQMPREADGWTLQQHALVPEQAVEPQLQQLAGAASASAFDLQHDWLLRVIYCEAAAGQSGLVVVIHHSVCDGLSISHMVRELAQHYAADVSTADSASANGGAVSSAPQYRDFVDHESRADNGKAITYWKNIFASAPETLDALLDKPRPVSRDFRGSAATTILAAPDAAAFESLCHAHNATLTMGLVALTQLLLARFANVGEVTLGTPVAGRPSAQFDKVVGPFVNTIALRQTVDRKHTFPALLTQVRRRVLEGFQHQGLAFDELVTELGFAKDPSRSPLYDVMLGFTTADELALSFSDGAGNDNRGRSLRLPQAYSKVDLTFHVEKDSDGSLRLDLEYATSVILDATARRLCDAWRLLVVALPQQPSRPMAEFALQSEADQRLLLDQVNATSRPYPQHSTLIKEFEKIVQCSPDAIAVHAGDVQLSYVELDVRSGQLAQVLLKHPAYQPGCHIALMLEKDERALIVILAILKSGCTYVPLAANTPLARVGEVLAAGSVPLLFAEAERMPALQTLDAALLDTDVLLATGDAALDAGPETASPVSGKVLPFGTRVDDGPQPAYLMFTSGSTGKPKGTVIEQRAVLRLVCNTDYHQVQANERVLLTGSLAFDAATFEIWGALLNGGCVCIPAGTTLLEVHEFDALVDHYRIDTAFLTTGLFNQLVDNSVGAFDRLQTVLTGGEKISVDHVRKILAQQPDLKLLHVYGPTENTTFSTWHRITVDDLALATIPIGRPIANSRIYLLDPDMRPVPVGVPGEIVCGGDGIARGYLAWQGAASGGASAAVQVDPFLADPFQPDSFQPGSNGRLYRTGDIAKWNHNRELVFLGRNDRQIKIRGFRVELGEVEHHLRTLPGVSDAFVQARGAAGSSELVAWLVGPGATHHTVAVVREALKGSVPNYMLPAKIVHIERLPLNASGKVDANALPLPEDTDAGDTRIGELHGKAEQDLAQLYAAVLGLSGSAALAIDREANFFSLGGDSIRAIQLVSQARAGGYHFTLKDIFASETLAGLAATAAVTPVAASEEALQSGPLSPTQHWWLDQCGPPADHFNLSSVFRVAEAIDIGALRSALDQLLALHPALRLSINAEAHQQSIRASGNYVLLTAGAGQTRQQCWQQLQQAIDLQAGILLAVGVSAEVDTSYVAVVVHHLAADEVSGRLFAQNLARLYQRQRAAQLADMADDAAVDATVDASSPIREPVPEALGIINWSAQVQAAVADGAMDGDLDYWQQVVARGKQIVADQSHLFADEKAPRDTAVQTLPQRETRTLLRRSAALLRMTPQEMVLAAFIRSWQASLGHVGCVLSLEGHGRETFAGLGDCSSTLGWFTSLYPFVFAGEDLPQIDLYRTVKDSIRCLPNKGFTYLPLRYYKGDDIRQTLTLRPQISFNYLGESVADQAEWLMPTNEPAGDDHGDAVVEPFKLDVLARVIDGRLELTLRGQNPRQSLGLAELSAAWLAELGTLASRLQDLSSSAAGDGNAPQCLLSLSDSLVAFASLAELDETLAALQLPVAGIEEILPLTGMQQGMWLHCATHPTAYQDQVALRLQQPVDEQRFAAAVRALVAETQALRTGFAQKANGELLQIVFYERSGYYQYLDDVVGAGVDSNQREETLVRLRASLRSKPRDLLHDPLFSLTLVRLDQSCFELIIDFHHMAIDGWTSALLLQRLEALYFADARGGDVNAASGMRTYFQWLGQQSPARAREYWQQLLGDYQSRSDVPAHLPRLPATEPTPLFVETRAGQALHARLLSWCEQHGLTLNAVVQTLWGVYLGRLTGSDDLVFGATVSGRDIELAGVGTIAGMLINTLPVRIQTTNAATFAEQVRETAQQFADSMSFGHLTLAEIQTLTPARAGLVTHALVFENYPAPDAGAARWQWQAQEIFDPMHFEFGLIVAPLANDLSFRFVADGSVYLQERLETMGTDLCAMLSALLDGQQSLKALAQDNSAGWTVSANFTADSLVGLLQYNEHISGRSAAVTLLPYDQSVQELINPDSRLRRLRPQQHVVLWRPVTDEAGQVVATAASGQLAELAAALAAYSQACPGSRLLVVMCPWFGCEERDSDQALYREFTEAATAALAGSHNAEVVSLENLADSYDLQQTCYPPELVFGDIPYTEAFFAAVANTLTRLSDLQRRRPVKVYIVDADDTLWGGIVGEEGADGVRLDAVHIRLQQQLLTARAAGALICLATKNNEEDVRAVFEQREMPLRWEHLTRVCASWRPKSDSVLALAEDLSLGLDSFVFIDDSPLECEQVLAACPGVLAIQLPPAREREAFLNHLWLLDARAATQEDAVRAQMYAEELQRANIRRTTETYADFLMSLDIRVDMHAMKPDELPRTVQLSQRTNQFNTTGIRYTEAELGTLLLQPDSDIRCISVTDKYGDYGLAGSVFIHRGVDVWTLTGFMLSCRVLGRGVEHSILRQLAQEAAAIGVGVLSVDFVKLPRNAPALQFLQSISSAATEVRQTGSDSQFRLSVSDAVHWQAGVEDSTAAQDESGTADVTVAADSDNGVSADDRVQRVTANTGQGSAKLSCYYQLLASTLNSGAGILHALQQQNVIQQTDSVARKHATKTPPETSTERVLAEFFTELLGQSDISREDSFHDLGGHSLKAMMLFSRIAARYGLTLDFRDLQTNPTLAALAARIDANALNADVRPMAEPVLRALPEADSYPVSPGQSRLWMLEQLRAAGPSPLHMHATLIVAGKLNRRALDDAIQALFVRHESLRTCFREDARGKVRQVVVPVEALAGALPADAQAKQGRASQASLVHWFDDVLEDDALTAMAQAHSRPAFDLSQAPLVRIAAGELASGDNVLFITLHHIISDGWSMGVFSAELTRLYQAFSNGQRPADISDATQTDSLQFRDFASWQLDWLASETGAGAMQFWREHFARPVEALQLPAAAPRPALMQSAGASVYIDIESAVWTGFSRQLSGLGISDFSGLLAALQLVLARLSGQQDFCIGTAVAGRQHWQLESVIGFFVNILPIRSTLTFDERVDQFLLAVAAEVNECLSHQGVPFDTIVANLDLARDPGRSPLFDVLLVLQNTEVEDLRFGTHTARVHPVASTTSQYDLTISAFPETDGQLRLLAEYNNAIYSRANIELILRSLQQTLKALTGSHSETLVNIPWLHDSDAACVAAFEGKSVDSEASDREQALLPDLFTQVAAAASGRISDGNSDWSYADLADEMQRIATLVRATQPAVKAGETALRKQLHVGVIGKRSVRSIAALLGTMAAGAIYIPLDLSNPLTRLLLIIDEGDVDLLLSTDDEGAELAAELAIERQQRHHALRHVHYTDAADNPGQAGSRDGCVDSSAIAYMIFTSGSTGKPKGVQISHAAFSAMIRQQIPAFDVHSNDVCGQFAALSFDASLSEVFLALGTGASLAIAPESVRSDIDAFMNWLNDSAVSVITLPPVFLRALDKRPLGALRVLVTAGEAAIGEDMAHYAQSLRVLNAYGPTETSVCASVYQVNAHDNWPFGVPIGKPLPGVLVTVRDAAGARVPVGAIGELYIGGDTLSQGYYGAAGLTAQKFTTLATGSDSESDRSQRRWYRSGDLVRWRDDGMLEFVGRVDVQLKIRGYRIEPGEIEHAARQVNGVDDALALSHSQSGLLLYCVTADAQDSHDALRSAIVVALGKTLPRHMLPNAVVLLAAFPLSSAGKIDRDALLARAVTTETAYVPPATDAERVLAQIWCRVLGVTRAGRHDDFFALGGDSIKALEVLNGIRATGYTCELKDFFAFPLLTDMASALAPWRESGLFRAPLAGHMSLLPVQRWFLRSRSGDAARHFNIVAELNVSADVSASVLADAMAVLIQHHDSLRCRFYPQNGQWLQEVQQTLSVDDVLSHYRRTTTAGMQADQCAIEELACRPFDLATGPLVRGILVQAPDGVSETLVLALHHLVADWVSLRTLIADLNALTQALLDADIDVARLSPPHLLQAVTDARCAELQSVPLTDADAYRKAVATTASLAPACGVHNELHTLHVQIAADDLTALREFLRRESAGQQPDFRLQDLLLATTLSELGGLLPVDEIPLLVESHGRDGELDLSRQVAWLTRARLVNIDPQVFTGADGLLQAYRVLQSDAIGRPDVFACMAADAEPQTALPALVSFNYLGEFTNSQSQDNLFTLTGRVFDKAMAPTSPVDVPLHMEFYVVDQALEIQVAWSPAVFKSDIMRTCWERVRRRFARL